MWTDECSLNFESRIQCFACRKCTNFPGRRLSAMRERRFYDTDPHLLDTDDDDDVDGDDNSSSSSELGECNWKVLTGVFIIQFVVTGVLASYGVLVLKLVETRVVSLRVALWTPLIYVMTWCFSDALFKRASNRLEREASRLLACCGILMVAGGVIVSSLLQRSHLQFMGCGILGGVGTSLVLTQTENFLYSHYPRHRHSAPISHLVPYLGSSVAQFAMPLLLLGFLSLYGTHEAPLLQAGLVLHGLVGAVILHPPTQKTPPISRYHSRPRAFTFVNDDSNSYFRDSYTGRNSLVSSSYGHNWRNPTSCNSHPKLNNCNDKYPMVFEIGQRCNKNGVEILPEILEEAEESSSSCCTDIHKDVHAESNDLKFTDKLLHSGARSMDGCLDTDEVNTKLIDSFSKSKRWSIGTVEGIKPVCVENGLTEYRPALGSSDSDVADEENKSYENIFENSKIDKMDITGRFNLFPVNAKILTTRSLVEVGPNYERIGLSDFDLLLSKSTEIRNFPVVTDIQSMARKVKSLNSVVPEFSEMKLTNQRSPLQEDISLSNVNTVHILSSNELNRNGNNVHVHVSNTKQPHDIKLTPKQWSTGTFEQMLSAKSTSFSLDAHQGQMLDRYRRWHSEELGAIDQSIDNIDSCHKIKSDVSFTIEVPEDPIRTYANATKTDEKCYEVHEVTLSLPGSREAEHPLWSAKLISSETVDFYSTSDNHQGSYLLRECSRCPSSLSQLMYRLVFSCSCHFRHCYIFHRQYSQNCQNPFFWDISEYVKIPYIFSSLLLRFTLRLCPMGFAVLSPLLAKKLIAGCTNGEAVFSVSISGFVWVCLIFATSLCSKMSAGKHKYLFAAGNMVAAYGLYLLSKAESHEKMALSCGIFGVGLGATMVTGNTTMYNALGSWNFAKVDEILDFFSGILVLVAGSAMNLFVKDQEGLTSCFTLLAIVYLVTGISWLLRPILNRLHCHYHINRIWSRDGRHTTSG